MDDLLHRLEVYGADIPGTMERFLGDEALYRRCLGLLLEEKNFAALSVAVSHQDAAAAFECAHALKGVVGNLGLTPLYETVCAAVESLRRGDLTHAEELSAAVLAGLTEVKQVLHEA